MNKTSHVFLVLVMSVLVSGCGFGTYYKQKYYAPQPTGGWNLVGGSVYRFRCDAEEVRVSPIILDERESANAYMWIPVQKTEEKKIKIKEDIDTPWSRVEFKRTPRTESCELTYFSLINAVTGERIAPSKAEIIGRTALSSKTESLHCLYLYNIKEEPNTKYELFVSDDALGCKVTPIVYKFKESTGYWPAISP
jgi:hypothetical protein